MATHPITDLLALDEILALQALDFGAQLHHFPARVLDWVNELRGGAAGQQVWTTWSIMTTWFTETAENWEEASSLFSTTDRPVRTGSAKFYLLEAGSSRPHRRWP